MALERFKGGRKSSREKLNAIVDVGKRLVAITGDETIYVVQTQHGTAIGVNVNTLAARMPKFGIHWAIATKPSVRTMDDCAWIRPENQYGVPTGTPYVYAYMSNSSGAGAPPGPLSSTFAADFLKIYLPGSGGQEPNIRDGDKITYYLSDGKLWIGPGSWYDGRIGDTRRIQNPGFGITEGRGWFWKDDTTVRYGPCIDVDTVPAVGVAGIDIEQTVDIEWGVNVAGHDRPLDLEHGEVGIILFTSEEAGEGMLRMWGNAAKTLERFN